jgi:hypothetical protein
MIEINRGRATKLSHPATRGLADGAAPNSLPKPFADFQGRSEPAKHATDGLPLEGVGSKRYSAGRPSGLLSGPANRAWPLIFRIIGGEGGIRTPETSRPVCRISSAVRSTTLPPLQDRLSIRKAGRLQRASDGLSERQDSAEAAFVSGRSQRLAGVRGFLRTHGRRGKRHASALFPG